MAGDEQQYQPGAMENVRAFVDRELRRGEEKADVVARLLEMGMDADSANALVDEFERVLDEQHETGRFTWHTGFPALVVGLFGAGLGAAAWGILALWTGEVHAYVALAIGVLGGLGVGLMARGRGLGHQMVGLACAIAGVGVGLVLLLLRFAPSEVFEPMTFVFSGAAVVVAWPLVFLLGGRFHLASRLRAKTGRTEHPTLTALLLLVVFVSMMTGSLFLSWHHWQSSPVGGQRETTEFDWALRSVTNTTGTATASYSYSESGSGMSANSFESLFDRVLAAVLFALALGVIGLLLFAYPYFGGRVADLYWFFTVAVIALAALSAAFACAYLWNEFPQNVEAALGPGGGIVDVEPSPSTEFWGKVVYPGAQGREVTWGAGLGWYLSLGSLAFAFGAAFLPWPGRHLKHLDKPGPAVPVAGVAPETPWPEAGAAPAPAEPTWEVAPEPAAEPAATAGWGPVHLQCPDCSTRFDLFPQPRPFDVVCPGCSRRTAVT